MMPSASIVLDNVTVCHQRRPAIRRITGVFASGSMTALVGPNGAGKSTLLAAIMQQLPLSTGHISRPASLAWLAQQSSVDRQFPITVAETVAAGAWSNTSPWSRLPSTTLTHIDQALATVGLAAMQNSLISDLSVGQLQRVRFARAIVQDAQAILLDEPFNAMDEPTTQDLLVVIHRWQQEGKTVLAALHDLQQVREHFPNTLLLSQEVIAWGDTREVLTPSNRVRASVLASHWHDDTLGCQRQAA